MDPIYEAVVARADELRLELKKLNEFIEVYRQTRYRLGLESVEHNVSVEAEIIPTFTYEVTSSPRVVTGPERQISTDEVEKARTRITDNPKPSVVVEAATEILLERGAPMTRRELHAALAERGLVVRGADPIKTLGTILWRSGDKFMQVEGYGYWPSAYPLPGPKAGDVEDLLG